MRPVQVLLLASSLSISMVLAQRALSPLPPDPRELVTGDVQVPATPDDRAAILSLLERGKQNSDMHMPGSPPFDIKLSFTASGHSVRTGAGEIREIWLSAKSWRYEQNLGDYSEIRIGLSGRTVQKKAGEVPLRVQMLRDAMFWPVRGNPSNGRIRSAAAQWEGKPVTCVLSGGGVDETNSHGRNWEETEYCVDNASGLLRIYSRAPGTYAVYAYGQNLEFHGRRVPDRITMYTGGAAVLEAHVQSIVDPGNVDPARLTPTAEMTPTPTNAANMRFPMPAANPSRSKIIRPVVVHAMIARDGSVLEQELSMASDPALAESAMDLVRKSSFPQSASLREAYINVKFR